MPNALITTALSTDVGPNAILIKQIRKQIIRMKKQRVKNGDCQLNKDGTGWAFTNSNAKISVKTPIGQRKYLIFTLVEYPL